MSYYVWSLNPLSPANTFLWLVSKSDKACICSQLIDRTVLIKQYPSLGKKSLQSHFTFSRLYCTKVFFLDEFIFLKLNFEFSESAALISLLNNYLLTGLPLNTGEKKHVTQIYLCRFLTWRCRDICSEIMRDRTTVAVGVIIFPSPRDILCFPVPCAPTHPEVLPKTSPSLPWRFVSWALHPGWGSWWGPLRTH